MCPPLNPGFIGCRFWAGGLSGRRGGRDWRRVSALSLLFPEAGGRPETHRGLGKAPTGWAEIRHDLEK
ncbi:hypothetical protein GJAV_G00225840 [Gymnothorax javanicus]|nr:hypothetical protein GJAV_G00225840 [Gymnothorax javanicus]